MTDTSTEVVYSDITPSDMFESLNGFDEIAIAKVFGAEISELREAPFRFLRSLVYVAERRGGKKDVDAYRAVMEMTVGDVTSYFAEEEDDEDLDPDHPSTEAGKDDEPSS